jgi:ABC-2 type transport system ATP-binding protein
MSLLKIENLGKRADGKWILWDVNLEVSEGEIVGVLGRSDSGKTALTRVIAGLDQPTNGSIVLGDPSEPEAITPSFAMSQPAYAPELTVHENVAMFAALWKVPGRKRGNEIARLLELLQLTESRAKRPAQLSSGALVRLEIARALVADCALTVIDGLLDHLDSDMLEKLWEYLLEQRRRRGKSVLIMTSSGKVAEMCSRLAVISRGKIVFLGRPDDFRRLAGDDLIVLGELSSPMVRTKIQERFSVVIREEDGFLSFRVAKGEKMVSDLLAEFGSELGCVYLKRPKLEDALDVLAGGGTIVAADASAAG